MAEFKVDERYFQGNRQCIIVLRHVFSDQLSIVYISSISLFSIGWQPPPPDPQTWEAQTESEPNLCCHQQAT